MAKKRKEKDAADIKLKQPDRSGPSERTLLAIAQERNLFEQADQKQRSNAAKIKRVSGVEDEEMGLSPEMERILNTILWAVCLSTLHFTLDVLVQHQYGMAVDWSDIFLRTGLATIVFHLLVYILHPHANSTLLPGLPSTYQNPLRQAIFLVTSTAAGCYLIRITNKFGYLAVMSQAPPVGCLWVWSVIELDLPLAVLSLACAGGYMWQGGYGIT